MQTVSKPSVSKGMAKVSGADAVGDSVGVEAACLLERWPIPRVVNAIRALRVLVLEAGTDERERCAARLGCGALPGLAVALGAHGPQRVTRDPGRCITVPARVELDCVPRRVDHVQVLRALAAAPRLVIRPFTLVEGRLVLGEACVAAIDAIVVVVPLQRCEAKSRGAKCK
eukprot:7250182-Prymnesium_polylepis.1